ncbi:MAG: GtrA family protein [Clostridia bacterium]
MIVNLIKKYKEVIIYLIFGLLTTLINILIYWILTKVLNIDYMISNNIAWCIAVLFAYVTNRKYVFDSKSKKKGIIKEIILFISARIFSLLFDNALMFIGITLLYMNDMIIKILANILVIIINYIMSKYIVFKKVV